jgi:exosortase/archaeosortase family protein
VATKHSNTSKINLKAAQPLLIRCAAFLVIFILETGLIGPKIISSKIFARDHFTIYGGLGKALIFTAIAFSVLAYRKFNALTKLSNKWERSNIVYLVFALACYIAGWVCVDKLIGSNKDFWFVLLIHLLLVASVVLFGIGTLGITVIRGLYKSYKKDILISLLVGAGFYVLLLAVYSLWTLLSAIVLHSVRWLLANINNIKVSVLPPRTLLLSRFGITVAEYCSGIESIALFSGLYAFIGVLDWAKLNKKKFFGIFVPALLVLFLLNILRVYLLILGGYYINEHIAFSLFHTYAGMVFFILYAAVFWAASYKWIISSKPEKA